MLNKDYKLYGTKILNLKTQEIGLLICLWTNKFVDGDVDFATCVDKRGKETVSDFWIAIILMKDYTTLGVKY